MSTRILFLCLVAWSVNLGANDAVPSASFIEKTETSIAGYDADLKIGFSSRFTNAGKSSVLVEIFLENKRITNQLDGLDPRNPNSRGNITFDLKALNIKTGKVTSLSADELRLLKRLPGFIGDDDNALYGLLTKTLALVLSTDPDGEAIDFSTQKIAVELKALARGYPIPLLSELKTREQWRDAFTKFPNPEGPNVVYATAGHEVRAWLQRVGRQGMHGLIEAIKAGESFDAAFSRIDSQAARDPQPVENP